MRTSRLRTIRRRARRERGTALLLVLIAVTFTLILALSFLRSSHTTPAIANNIDTHRTARDVAESGLALAINYLRDNPDWRSEKTEGTWISNQPLMGGAWTLTVTDGDETGGDSDLSDDEEDLVYLQVVGAYNGATHRVGAVVTIIIPEEEIPDESDFRVLLVVSNKNSLKTRETEVKDLLESWGWTVSVIDDNDPQSAFNAALANVDAAYFTDEASTSKTGHKLSYTTKAVVTEDGNLIDELGIALADAETATDSVNIINNTHYITKDLPLGSFQLSAVSAVIEYIAMGEAPGLTVLATIPGSGKPAIAVLEPGATMTNGNPAPGRRVMISYENYDADDLTEQAKPLLKRTLFWSVGAGDPVFDVRWVEP